ncbi:TetR family transcriptional regulator [Mycolicibacterium moriokaense]|uniref:TetR family transcriptional regulator n=1 Tax=Mycolicibacterium moriokaense TaxID=39691 RepID=A0AAD1HAC7_9MYCO|nr:TetR/AcrR family transcriptional regulator [Mycolicibacterium moriokaense]MCV7043039.1 TetR family transcriptional regulator [Mycolicibacterium moriokaense]ORB18027.1 TetR family transcriptional regulator [Mycolicibacterium moriokaense]BBX00954.1 TetR family transcriptional regulator [Mycolicibacterium moriokaense]
MDQRRARGQRNREALIAAALDLFTAKGYEQTTVEQIAESAGVAPRTFFHHFATKDDILFDGYADRLAEAIRRFRAARSGSLWDALAEASEAVATAIAEHPDIFLVRATMYGNLPALRATMLRINDDWIDQMTTEVARWLDADADMDVRPRLAATVINGANRAAIDLWVAGGGTGDLKALMSEAVRLLRPSINRIEREVKQGRSRRVG